MAQRNPGNRPEPVKPRPAALTITHPMPPAVPSSYRDDEPVRELASFTADLDACRLDTVAMECTGVY
mgnify:FL=1